MPSVSAFNLPYQPYGSSAAIFDRALLALLETALCPFFLQQQATA